MTTKETWEKLTEIGIVSGKMPIGKWDLRELHLKEENFREAKFIAANLRNAMFEKVILSKANLSSANLSQAFLWEIDLREADLSRTDLTKTDFKGADLRGANLYKANLRHANLFNANLSRANISEANLIDANLSYTNLSGANISKSNLSGANLCKAKLNQAELNQAKLIRANLSDTILKKTNLKNSDLTASILINANLTGAICNGICLDYANLSSWIIRDVMCTHIIQNTPTKKVIKFQDKEFEKKYTRISKLAEIILNIPLTESAGFIGKFISQSINSFKQSDVISLKAVEALSDDDTKFVFNIFDNDFYKNQKELVETALKDALNQYFKENPLKGNPSDTDDIVRIATGGLIKVDDIKLVGTPFKIDGKTIQDKLTKYFLKLNAIGTDIQKIIFTIFK